LPGSRRSARALSSDRDDDGLHDPIEADAGSPADLCYILVGASPDQNQQRLLTWHESAGQQLGDTALARRRRLLDKPSHRSPRGRLIQTRRVTLAEIRRLLRRSSASRHQATLAWARRARKPGLPGIPA